MENENEIKDVNVMGENGLYPDEYCGVCGNGILFGYKTICNNCKNEGETENA